MDKRDIQNIRNAFDSILRADYITLDNIEELDNLSNYYIDYFGITQALLQKQDNFISGRRGTGKTTNLLSGYYECLKTISPKLKNKECFFTEKKILPIFIDLSTCNDLFDSNDDLSLVEVHFVRQIIESLKRQLEIMFDESFLLIFKKENPALSDLEYIEKILVEGLQIRNSRQIKVSSKESSSDSLEAEVSASFTDINASIKAQDSNSYEYASSFSQIRGVNIQDFFNKINDIKKKAEIDSIYVFIDEFSDLNSTAQVKFSHLLKSLLGSRIGMYFKISVITDRYNFGEKIIVGRDIFHVPLDFNDYVERYRGAVEAMNKMEEFVTLLIQKRISTFCPELEITDIFKSNMKDIYYRITRATIGVTRTIGIILQNAFIQSQLSASDTKIGLAEINYGISTARKTYQKQFYGSVRKKLIPGHYLDMWTSIMNKAVAEKNKNLEKAASHILVDPIRKDYLNVYCENFMLHFLSENVSSKHGGNYNLYAIDYDICIEKNIKFADIKDDYTQIRFIYDLVLSQFDPYFLNEKSKSYRCPSCGKIYKEIDVKQHKVKRCFDDDSKLEEIIHQETPMTYGNFAEVEIKILGLISELDYQNAMTARAIADAVGCTVQKVSLWGSKVLKRDGHILIREENGRNLYYGNNET